MDDIDKIHALLKEHGAVLERTKKHKIWRFPDQRIWVVSGSPSCSRAYKNNYHSLCAFLGVKEVRRKNPDRKRKPGITHGRDFKPSAALLRDHKETLAVVGLKMRGIDMAGGTIASNYLKQMTELEQQIATLKRGIHRANLRNASLSAQLKMTEDQRDSWLPWWLRQSFFKFMRRHFPWMRKFLKGYVLQDYLSKDTLLQMHVAHKEDQQLARQQRDAAGAGKQ